MILLTMNPKTQSYFVKETGLSKQAISKACKAGKFTMCTVAGKDMIDLDGYLTVEWLYTHPFKNKNNEAAAQKNNEENTNEHERKPITHKTKLKYNTDETAELKRQKIREDIEKIKIDNDKKRGDLIPKILIKRLFSKLYSIDENQFKNLGVNVSPKISSIYNSSNAEKTSIIMALIDRKDEELKKDISKILNSGESDRILKVNSALEDATNGILLNIQRAIDMFLRQIA